MNDPDNYHVLETFSTNGDGKDKEAIRNAKVGLFNTFVENLESEDAHEAKKTTKEVRDIVAAANAGYAGTTFLVPEEETQRRNLRDSMYSNWTAEFLCPLLGEKDKGK